MSLRPLGFEGPQGSPSGRHLPPCMKPGRPPSAAQGLPSSRILHSAAPGGLPGSRRTTWLGGHERAHADPGGSPAARHDPTGGSGGHWSRQDPSAARTYEPTPLGSWGGQRGQQARASALGTCVSAGHSRAQAGPLSTHRPTPPGPGPAQTGTHAPAWTRNPSEQARAHCLSGA